MSEFLNGWRRKAGCITLVMACVLMTAWVRSRGIRDSLIFTDGDQQHLIISRRGRVTWETWQKVPLNLHLDLPNFFLEVGPISPNEPPELRTRWIPGNFFHGPDWDIPYWSVVLPLILLSGYLILWKPQSAAKPVDPLSTTSK